MAWDIVDEHGVAVAVDDRPGRRCIASGTPTVGEVFGMRVPGGGLKWIEIDARPLLRTGDDGPYAVVSTVRDVTDKISAQRAAATAEHRHRLVLANAAEGYHVVDDGAWSSRSNPPINAASALVDSDGRMTFALLDETDHQTMNDVLENALARSRRDVPRRCQGPRRSRRGPLARVQHDQPPRRPGGGRHRHQPS